MEKNEALKLVKKHLNCKGPHKTNNGYVSCLVMVYSKLSGKKPWDIVKELKAERRYENIPKRRK